jgi:hypothetical protein
MASFGDAGAGPVQPDINPMNFKTAILGSAAAAFLIASPVLAQDAATAAPQTPAAQEPAAQPSLSLTPGTSVQGPDGELGKLEGVQNNASGAQELTVRGADGQLRAVPLNGIRQEGANVAVAYTKAEFDAAAPIAGATPAPAPAPAAEPAATEPTEPTEPTTTDPADPSGSSDPMAPPTGDQPQG